MPRYFTVVCRLEGDAAPKTVMDAIEALPVTTGKKVVLSAMSHGHVMDERDRYRAALGSLYEAANTKDRVSLDDLEAAHRALNP